MYYPSSKTKGADRLRGYREADLRLCFRIIMQTVCFLMRQLNYQFVMKGVFNLSKAITCLNLLLVPVPDVDPVELLINKKAGTAEVVWNGAF